MTLNIPPTIILTTRPSSLLTGDLKMPVNSRSPYKMEGTGQPGIYSET